jgi:hypothetical protein
MCTFLSTLPKKSKT